MSSNEPKVLIVMGSDSDLPVMQAAADILEKFEIPFEMTVASAHRSPQRATELATKARTRGVGAVIAGAGHAAHLAGVLAAHTSLPVIGVPLRVLVRGDVDGEVVDNAQAIGMGNVRQERHVLNQLRERRATPEGLVAVNPQDVPALDNGCIEAFAHDVLRLLLYRPLPPKRRLQGVVAL